MDKETFFLEEYKCLRSEIGAAQDGRQDFNKWGLIGLGALYSFMFANFDKQWAFPALFWVPFGLAAAMLWHMLDTNSLIGKAGRYIRTEIEPWMTGPATAAKPKGWETFLTGAGPEPWQWTWSPVPLWTSLTIGSGVLALILTLAWCHGWRPAASPNQGDKKSTAAAHTRQDANWQQTPWQDSRGKPVHIAANMYYMTAQAGLAQR